MNNKGNPTVVTAEMHLRRKVHVQIKSDDNTGEIRSKVNVQRW